MIIQCFSLERIDLRKIIHLDADCFYASVEILKKPELFDKPVAVGGQGRRGVISTCNYVARKFGVRSAMASAKAMSLCPELIILPACFEDYKAYSSKIFDIYRQYTDKIEPLSMDEAFLDVSDSTLCGGSATFIAEEIRQRVFTDTGLTVSAGVAPLKFLAKVASDWNKPNGIFVIRPAEVQSFIDELAIKKLPGVGPVTAEKLARHGIYSAKDLKVYGQEWLIQNFGKFGQQLFRMSLGEDERDVKVARERKSISVETTFSSDILEFQELESRLASLLEELEARFNRLQAPKKVYKRFVKLKFNDFSRTSAETTFQPKADAGAEQDQGSTQSIFCINSFRSLLLEARSRSSKAVRLMGVGLRFVSEEQKWEQLGLLME